MPVTKVRSKWSSGDLIFEDLAGTEILRIDGTNAQVKINTVAISSATLDELAALNGLTASVAELNLADGSVAGTAVASKLLALGADKNVDTLAVADSGLKLGAGAGTAVTKTAAQINALVGGIAGAYRVARGQLSTASALDTVVTGLTTVVSAVAVLESDPVDTCSVATCAIGDQAGAPAAGSIYVKTWKPTVGGAAGNPTLIAATAFTKLVNWIAVGT